jgi:hypothetical protein
MRVFARPGAHGGESLSILKRDGAEGVGGDPRLCRA